MQTKYLFVLLLAFLSQNAFADDYPKYAAAVRDSIWGWDLPQFKDYKIAAKYKNESAVILAEHDDILATGRKKIRFTGSGFLGFSINKELYYTITNRKMLLINDKTALEEHTELKFRESEKSYGRTVSTETKMIVGARVIKPTGEIVEVNIEDESVSITEGKKDKEDYKKIAIPNLQVGDILDYFTQVEGRIDYENMPPFTFFFANKYPIKNYTIHCELGDKLTTEFRSVNGAPAFSVARNENNDVILDVQKQNIPKAKGTIWLSPLRELPAIRLSVLYNSHKHIFKPQNARKQGVYKDLDVNNYYRDAMGYYAVSTYYTVVSDIDKRTKKHFKDNKNASKEEIADFINNALLSELRNPYYFKTNTYIHSLQILFKKFKIEHKIGFVTDRYDAAAKDVSLFSDLNTIIIANNNTQFFSRPLTSRILESYDPYYEGEYVMTVVPKKLDPKSKEGIKGEVGKATYPISSYMDNSNTTITKAKFDKEDLSVLDISRNVTLKGHLRSPSKAFLITYTDWDAAIAKEFGNKSMLEEIGKNKKKLEEYNAQAEEQKKEQKKSFEEEIKDFHDVKAKELVDYSISNYGISKQNPEISYTINYKMDGLIKRAGNNYIIDAGKLIGSQIKIDEADRERDLGIYMPFARSYNDNIEITIPEGYVVEGLDNLNRKVDNECASFISSASFSGNTLTLKTSKIYKNLYDPVSNWNKIVQVVDESQLFSGQSVVLKKK